MPFSDSTSLYTAPLELIVADLWGPTFKTSRNNFKYYNSFVDVYSRYTWIYFLNSKFEAFPSFLLFKKYVEKLLGKSIIRFQSDNGGEFRALTSFLKANGIEHKFTCPYTSQQNGIVERKLCQIVDTGLTLLSHASLSLEFWYDVFSTAIYLINRLPTVAHNLSPLEKLFGLQPNYVPLKTFGCLCFPSLRPYNQHKIDPRSTPCIFLGYSSIHKGYKCLSSSGRLYISQHVLFDENTFPSSSFLSSQSKSYFNYHFQHYSYCWKPVSLHLFH